MSWRAKIWPDCKRWEKFGSISWNGNFEEIVLDPEPKAYLKFSLWLTLVISLADKLNETIHTVFGLFKRAFEGTNARSSTKIIVLVLEIKFALQESIERAGKLMNY